MRDKTISPCILKCNRFYKFAKAYVLLGGVLSLTACSGAWRHDPYSLPIAQYDVRPRDHATPSASTDLARQVMRQECVKLHGLPDSAPECEREVVLLTFRQDVTAAQKDEVVRRLSHLSQDARHANGSRMIASIEIGWSRGPSSSQIGDNLFFILRFRPNVSRYIVRGPFAVRASLDDNPAFTAFSALTAPLIVDRVAFGYHPIIVRGVTAQPNRAR